MGWELKAGAPQKPETVSVETNNESGETRSIYRYPVPGGWLYQFVNERGRDRFESIAFVPGK